MWRWVYRVLADLKSGRKMQRAIARNTRAADELDALLKEVLKR